MLRSGVFLSFFSIVTLALGWSVTNGRAQTSPVSTADTSRIEQVEKETFALINGYRRTNHLPALVWDAEIAKIARGHSRDMATGEVDFGHEGFSDRMSGLRRVFAGMRGGGENVLMTDDPADLARKAVDVWLQSPPHLHNIRGDFNYSGIGIGINAAGTIYFTQIFVKILQTAHS